MAIIKFISISDKMRAPKRQESRSKHHHHLRHRNNKLTLQYNTIITREHKAPISTKNKNYYSIIFELHHSNHNKASFLLINKPLLLSLLILIAISLETALICQPADCHPSRITNQEPPPSKLSLSNDDHDEISSLRKQHKYQPLSSSTSDSIKWTHLNDNKLAYETPSNQETPALEFSSDYDELPAASSLELTGNGDEPALHTLWPGLAHAAYLMQQSDNSIASEDQNVDSGQANNLDLPDQGSGMGWPDEASDSSSNSNNIEQAIRPTPVLSSPALEMLASPRPGDGISSNSNSNIKDNSDNLENYTNGIDNGINRAPLVVQRLPKLWATAGLVWRYFIPADTITDEDGDLRQLNSIIVRSRNGFDSSSSSNDISSSGDQLESIGQYHSWLQYDQRALLLYALPTSDNLGSHQLMVLARDRHGALANESLEIHVRQHQSIRAFTHSFKLNSILIEQSRFPSLIDAVGELVKRLASRLYHDHPFKNLIIRSYDTQRYNQLGWNNETHSYLDLTWSNGSSPIYPCKLDELARLAKPLIDSKSESLADNWLLSIGSTGRNFTPSEELIQILAPEFQLSSVAIQLHAACESPSTDQNQPDNSIKQEKISDRRDLRVGKKIGRLSWSLGEPIEYQIPSGLFVFENGSAVPSDQLRLSLHTIDGLTLDKDPNYSFLEFDSSQSTIYGLSYSSSEHVGLRELQLTGQLKQQVGAGSDSSPIREIFVIEILGQDLTLVGNRAFRMSLYLIARTNNFGPQERVALSRKMTRPFRSALDSNQRESPLVATSSNLHPVVAVDE